MASSWWKVNEEPEQGLLREIREELGIEIEILKHFGDNRNYMNGVSTLVHWYECSPLTFTLAVGGDLAEAKRVRRNDVLRVCPEEVVKLYPESVKEYLMT
ncbi:MAG TPA: NUDIX domain-containing protein [Candidatus Nanoarchaeia archaeon]|nr:NUDIX domain-containing protein [Candidatus Nanoarchaeia archaeon]